MKDKKLNLCHLEVSSFVVSLSPEYLIGGFNYGETYGCTTNVTLQPGCTEENEPKTSPDTGDNQTGTCSQGYPCNV